MRLIAVIFLACGAIPLPVHACSPMHGWKPPTPQSAYRDAEVVVHLRVLSQEQQGFGSVAQVKPIRILKGIFVGETVSTGASSMCGIESFKVGAEYVFFFRGLGGFVKPPTYYVSHLEQPWQVTTAQILEALDAK